MYNLYIIKLRRKTWDIHDADIVPRELFDSSNITVAEYTANQELTRDIQVGQPRQLLTSDVKTINVKL